MQFNITKEELNRIPMTGDGKIIYPGMSVYVVEPFSVEKFSEATIYCVIKECDVYACVLEENRFFDGECWNDGNTECVYRVYADKEKCLAASNKIEKEYD